MLDTFSALLAEPKRTGPVPSFGSLYNLHSLPRYIVCSGWRQRRQGFFLATFAFYVVNLRRRLAY